MRRVSACSELMPSSLGRPGCVVHAGFSFCPIVSQLLPGVNVDLHTYKVSFDRVFEAEMGTADWTLALSELSVPSYGMRPSHILGMWPSQRSLRFLRRETSVFFRTQVKIHFFEKIVLENLFSSA